MDFKLKIYGNSSFLLRFQVYVVFVVVMIFLISCSRSGPPQQFVSQSLEISETKQPITNAIISTSTTSTTTSDTATLPPTQSSTPSTTPSPTPIKITRENWQHLSVVELIGDGQIRNVAWSADGSIFAIGFSHSIRIFGNEDFSEITRIESLDRISPIELSPDGSQVAAGSMNFDIPEIRVWDTESGEIINKFTDNKYPTPHLQYSSDGSLLAAGSFSEQFLWDIETKERIDTPEGASPPFKLIADIDIWISNKGDEGLWVWNLLDDPLTPYKMLGHDGEITSFDITDDGKSLVSADSNGNVILWAGPKGVENRRWSIVNPQDGYCPDYSGYELKDCTTKVLISNDGSFFLTKHLVNSESIGSILTVWDFKGTILWKKHLESRPNSVQISPDGRTIALTYAEELQNTVVFYDSSDGNIIDALFFPALNGCINRFEISEQVSQNWNEKVFRHYDIDGFSVSWSREFYLSSPDDSYAISPNGELIAVIGVYSGEWTTRLVVSRKPFSFQDSIIDFDTHSAETSNREEYNRITDVAFSNNGDYVSASAHLHIITWDTQTGEQISDIKLNDDVLGNINKQYYRVGGIVYTDDDILLAVGHRARIHAFDPSKGEYLGTLTQNVGVSHGRIIINSTGSQIAIGTCGSGAIMGEPTTSDDVVSIWGITP